MLSFPKMYFPNTIAFIFTKIKYRNMYKKFLLGLFILLSLVVNSQAITPEKLGFRHYQIASDSLGEINYYVSSNSIEKKKPVLLYLDGSGANPLFQYTERGIGSTVILDFKELSENYHVVLISKPGIPFIDSVKMNEETGFPLYEHPQEYKKKLSLEWRVYSAQLVLEQILKNIPVEKKKVAVLGISEGFQVGAKLTSITPNITHSLLFVGNGLNQFYDFIIQHRVDAQSGKISEEEAQKNVDFLLSAVKDIYANPTATDKEWYGHTYLRWASFTRNNPTENILSVNTPIYIAVASKDRNTTVLGTDYLYLESIRNHKKNITYNVYPYDHSFREITTDEKGNIISVTNHMNRMIKEGIKWLDEN